MTNELTDVRCPCGTEFPAESYDAGFIAGSGMCQNCDAALPPKDICTCPSGDGSLRHPCPAHPAVEQAGGDERVIGWRERILAAHPNSDPGFWTDALLVEHMAAEIADLRAALAHPSPTQAEQHWPKLEQPAKVGGVRFSAGVSSRLVVEAAQRLYKFESTPEKEAGRIERLQAFREQLDPFNLAPHAEAFNEAPAEALKPEPAEAERPEVVGSLYLGGWADQEELEDNDVELDMKVVERLQVDLASKGDGVHMPLMTVAQHERIVGALRAEIAEWQEAAGRGRSDVVAYIAERAKLLEGRDATLARVAELEAKLSDPTAVHQWQFSNAWFDGSEEVVLKAGKEGSPIRTLYAAPVAQAQPEETPGEILAAKLIETWVTEHGKPAPWSTAVEITAVATNMPNDERDRLLALDDDVDAQAQHSVPDDVETFLDEVRAELLRARSKFPGDRIMTIALAEEFGELCKAVLDEPAANVRKEAVQTAVMAARVVLDGDGSVTAWRAERGLDPLAAAPGKEGL